MYRVLAVTAIVVVGCSHANGGASPSSPIHAADLRRHVYVLADDSMQGRFPGTRGNVLATEYVAAEFRRLGLRPAGDSGGYFQYVPLVSAALDTTETLAVGNRPLVLWRDLVPINLTNGDADLAMQGVPVLYAGRLGPETPEPTTVAAAGKMVVYTIGRAHDGSVDFRSTKWIPMSRMAGAVAIAIVYPDAPPVSMNSRLKRFSLVTAKVEHRPLILQIGHVPLAQLFAAQSDSLVKPGVEWNGAVTGRVRFRLTDTVWARNVVAVLPGRDSALRGEYVAMGAHNDHLGVGAYGVDHDSLRTANIMRARLHLDGPAVGNPAGAAVTVNVDSLRRIRPARRDSIFNGADDDAAGTASLLAIAQAFVQGPRPARSLLFVSHAAEEQGALGSRWFVEHATVPRDSIVAYLNMDLFGHGYNGDSARSGPRYIQSGGARRLSTELGKLIDATNAALAEPMMIDYSWDAPGHPSQKYCRSDHTNYARYGIPVAFFSTGYSVDYHQLTDEPGYLDYAHMARAATLVYAVARDVADLSHRPVVDHPKPDPDAPCRQ